MKLQLPDYTSSPANLACSLLSFYGITPPNPPLELAAPLLTRPWKCVILILLDGLGVNILDKHLADDSFFKRHMIGEYSSTFPPTTVASTTALLSGLMPNQNAWLGWSAYFAAVGRNVSYFWNTDNDTGAKLTGGSIAERYVPYVSILDRIAKTGVETHSLASFRMDAPRTFARMCDELRAIAAKPNRTFTYAYWDEPDHTMHLEGIGSPNVHEIILDIDRQLQSLAMDLNDALLLVTADHGHIDVDTAYLDDDPVLCDMLLRRPSFESRTVNFFVKPEAMKRFPERFNARFADAFRLYTHREVVDMRLFGTGESHPRFESFLGDYLAVATDRLQIVYTGKTFKGNHAGFTADEMRIPLFASLTT